MHWKFLFIFFSICLIVLVSLDAIADDNAPKSKAIDEFKIEGQKEMPVSQESAKADAKSCETTKPSGSKSHPTKTQALKETPTDYSNLSFNFIYYILYKFKYIDSFGLSEPEKANPPRKENILWH